MKPGFMRRGPIMIWCGWLLLVTVACGTGAQVTPDKDATIVALQATNAASENAFLKQTISAGEAPGGGGKPVTGQATAIGAPPVEDGPKTNPAPGPGGDIEPENIPLPTPADALFFDDFSNTAKGWSLGPIGNGQARLVRAGLVATSQKDTCTVIPYPNVQVESSYYTEFTASVAREINVALGFAIGRAPAEFHKFGVAHYDINSGYIPFWRSFVYNPASELNRPDSVTEQPALWELGVEFSLGLEANGNEFTLYQNGQQLETSVIPVSGRNIGLFLCDFDRPTEVRFDNVSLRAYR